MWLFFCLTRQHRQGRNNKYRVTAIIDTEREAIESYGLLDLKSRLPKKPNAYAVKVINEMFEASIDGEFYDAERWAQYFAPYGLVA